MYIGLNRDKVEGIVHHLDTFTEDEQTGELNRFDCNLTRIKEENLHKYAIMACECSVELTTVSSDIENN